MSAAGTPAGAAAKEELEGWQVRLFPPFFVHLCELLTRSFLIPSFPSGFFRSFILRSIILSPDQDLAHQNRPKRAILDPRDAHRRRRSGKEARCDWRRSCNHGRGTFHSDPFSANLFPFYHNADFTGSRTDREASCRTRGGGGLCLTLGLKAKHVLDDRDPQVAGQAKQAAGKAGEVGLTHRSTSLTARLMMWFLHRTSRNPPVAPPNKPSKPPDARPR